MGEVDGDVVLGNRLNADAVGTLHHQPVDADILDIVIVPVVGIARDDAGLVDVEAAVSTIEPEQREQIEKVDVLFDADLLPGCGVDAFDLARKELEAARELEELFLQRGALVHAERQGMIGPRAVGVHDDLRPWAAGDLVETDRGHVGPDLRQGAGGGRKVGLELHFLGDMQQLTFPLEQAEERTEIGIGLHGYILSMSSVVMFVDLAGRNQASSPPGSRRPCRTPLVANAERIPRCIVGGESGEMVRR